MPYLVELRAPGDVATRDIPLTKPGPQQVVVRTRYSGISAGTELSTYRGTNPYLDKLWDPDRRLFLRGRATQPFPVDAWGYSEVGTVQEVGVEVSSLRRGDVVWGIWGHRSIAVLDAEQLSGHQLPSGLDPLVGTFDRVGAVALNAVLASEARLGESVAVFGQGVIGLLATQLLTSMGCSVVAVDTMPLRRSLAERWGAVALDPAAADVALAVQAALPGGVDRVIELSGAYPALQQAIRVAGPDGAVIAAGFYQGSAVALALGEEFHHNRVSIVPSQIGGLPLALQRRWSRDRLHQTVMRLCASGRLNPLPLVSHVIPAQQAARAYTLLESPPPDLLQVVLDFGQGDR